MALPLAILLSSIMVFGNLAERYELVAIKSAGVSLLRAMRPMLVICILLAVGAFFTANNLIPKANLSWGALLYDVTQKKPAMNIVDNVFFKDIEGYQIRVGKKHDDNQTIEDIIIYVDDRKGGNNNILLAKRGKMIITDDKQFMTLHLEEGQRYQELVDDPNYKETMPHNTMKFATYDLTINLSELAFNRTEKERFSEDHRMMNITQLQKRVDSLDRYIAKKRTGLYKYLEPYFYLVKDTIDISDTAVQARFDYLIASKNKKNSKTIKLEYADVEKSSSDSPRFPKPKKIEDREKVTINSILSKEDVITRALQNVNNAKRISMNNVDDTFIQKEMRAKYLVEWHRKFTLAVSCILLFFIGAPLGAIIKKGGFGLPLVISILLFILYYVLSIFGEKLVKQGVLPAFTGMWLSLFILFPLAIFLTYKASRDSQLFNAEAYKKALTTFTPKWLKRSFNKK